MTFAAGGRIACSFVKWRVGVSCTDAVSDAVFRTTFVDGVKSWVRRKRPTKLAGTCAAAPHQSVGNDQAMRNLDPIGNTSARKSHPTTSSLSSVAGRPSTQSLRNVPGCRTRQSRHVDAIGHDRMTTGWKARGSGGCTHGDVPSRRSATGYRSLDNVSRANCTARRH